MAQIRWQRIRLPIGLAAIATIGSVIACGPHPYRVALARGRWCAIAQPNGSNTLVYGKACDQIPGGQALQFLWDQPQGGFVASPEGDRI